jgi:ABC-2 type transport system ATP-binding protein
MSSTLITAKGLSKSFNKKVILKNIDFSINQNEIFGIIGVSGSGKSTLLETVIGFLQPDKGDITIDTEKLGKDVHFGTVSVFKRTSFVDSVFGYASQEPSFYGSLTIEQNLKYFGSLFGVNPRDLSAKITDLLTIVDLKTERKTLAGNLSLGMQKRLDLACALVHDPKILILDEPSADLDIITRNILWEAIKKIKKQGRTIILATHSMDEVQALCDRIAILNNHKIQYLGTPQEIAQEIVPNHTIRLQTEKQNYKAILESIKRERLNVTRAVKQNGTLILHTNEPSVVMKSLLTIIEYQQHTLLTISVEEPNIENAFKKVMQV